MNDNTLPGRIDRYIEHVTETGNPHEPGDPRDGEWHEFHSSWDDDGTVDVWIDDEYVLPDEKRADLSDAIARGAMTAIERAVVTALAEDYDGVDIEHTPSGTTIHRWNDSPPSYDPMSAPAERYDLRDVTFADLREAWQTEDGEYRSPPDAPTFSLVDTFRLTDC